MTTGNCERAFVASLGIHRVADDGLSDGHRILRCEDERLRITAGVGGDEPLRWQGGAELAAQQVGHALQLTVIDVREEKDRPSTLELDGQPADVTAFMPLVLINPQIQPEGEWIAGPEGCLSLPEVYADITRQEFVQVKALNAKGEPFAFKAGGLLARAVQHEVDHLNGTLFIDRMTTAKKKEFQPELDLLMAESKAKQGKKS